MKELCRPGSHAPAVARCLNNMSDGVGCTLALSKATLNLEKNRLCDVYKHFYGEDFTGAHTALSDARATSKVFMKLLEEKKINFIDYSKLVILPLTITD